MKNKQEHIDAIAPHTCFVCEMNTGFCECIQHGNELCGMAYEAADRIYKAGYRKASDVIDDYESKMKQFILENCCVTADDVDKIWKALKNIAEKMRQEVEK